MTNMHDVTKATCSAIQRAAYATEVIVPESVRRTIMIVGFEVERLTDAATLRATASALAECIPPR